MVKSLLNNFNSFREDKLTLWLNHLLVVYAFVIPISERGKSAIFFVILLLVIIRGNFKFNFQIALKNKVVLAMLAFFLVHIIWLYGTENIGFAKSVMKDMKYLLFPLLFLTFLDKRFFNRILTAFILGMFYSEVISYLMHFNIISNELILFGKEVYKSQAIGNPTPFLNHARYTIFLTLVIGFLLYNVLYVKRELYIKIISLVFILTATFNLSLIGGRIGYISFVVIISFLLLKKYRDTLLRSIFTIIVGMFLILNIFYNTSSLFKERVDLSLNSLSEIIDNNNYNSSIGQRLGIWKHAINVGKDNYIFGVGTGDQLDETMALVAKDDFFLLQLSHLHNEYIKNFLQFGIVGFLLYLNIFYQILKYPTENQYRKDIMVILTLSILIATLTSIFSSGIYLALFITIISSAISTTNTLKDKFTPVDLRMFIIYAVMIAISFIIAFLQ